MKIQLINPVTKELLSEGGGHLMDAAGNLFFSREGAWRFVSESNYADNFGFQWNKFQKTQMDRFQEGVKQSAERFFTATGWDKENLSDKNILEVGSGAGRFSRVVLESTLATLYSVDYSSAVDANAKNNGPNPRFHLFQASLYELPFAPGQFDKVFCFGVLQHTPDPEKSVKALIDMVKPGGELIVDFYPYRGWYTKIHAKYLLRPLTRKISQPALLSFIQSHVGKLIFLYRLFDDIGIGKIANRFLPICDINHTIPAGLDEATQREWIILDTFDMFSPAYDKPQHLKKVSKWFTDFGMRQVSGEVVRYGNNNSVTLVRGLKK